MLPVRTNNATAASQGEWDTALHGCPPLYLLVNLLHKESLFVKYTAGLVSDQKLLSVNQAPTDPGPSFRTVVTSTDWTHRQMFTMLPIMCTLGIHISLLL